MAVRQASERREIGLTRRCAWCGDVDTGTAWRRERRSTPGPSTHAMCPACLRARTRERA